MELLMKHNVPPPPQKKQCLKTKNYVKDFIQIKTTCQTDKHAKYAFYVDLKVE